MITINEFSNKNEIYDDSIFFFFCFEIFLALKTALCHYHKFRFFFLSFRIRKPDDGRVLRVTDGDHGEG